MGKGDSHMAKGGGTGGKGIPLWLEATERNNCPAKGWERDNIERQVTFRSIRAQQVKFAAIAKREKHRGDNLSYEGVNGEEHARRCNKPTEAYTYPKLCLRKKGKRVVRNDKRHVGEGGHSDLLPCVGERGGRALNKLRHYQGGKRESAARGKTNVRKVLSS